MGSKQSMQAATTAAQLRDLRQQLAKLSERVAAIERGAAMPSSATGADAPADDAAGAAWSWHWQSSLLSSVATISFVLVVALVLRTLTDADILARELGIWLGVGYAGTLLLVGWRGLAHDRPTGRLLPVCGAALLCALVAEAHTRFDYLAATTTSGLLAATLLCSAALGLRYRAPVVVEVGVVAAATTAVALGFPTPLFPFAAAMLMLAMVAAAAVGRMRQAAWLHWFALGLLLLFWLLWTVKLHAPLARGEPLAPALMLEWYLPSLGATFAVLLAVGWRSARGPTSAFGLALPTCNMVAVFGAAAAVAVPWLSADRALGAFALVLAALHFAIAWRFARKLNPAAAASFALAAVAAFVPAVWLSSGSLHAALPLWSLAALLIARWSGRLASSGLRGIACCLQVAAVGPALAAGVFAVPPTSPWLTAAVGACLATIAGAHYRWTRLVPPPAGSWYVQLSPTDHPGVLTLWASITAVFCCLRVGLYEALAQLPIALDNAFAGTQSVLVNGMAIALLLLARRARSRPVLATASLVATIGGVKVFAADFLTLQGVPLVLSVFSFGMVAAVGSVIVGRWPRPAPTPSV